jgi:hypothetical protein
MADLRSLRRVRWTLALPHLVLFGTLAVLLVLAELAPRQFQRLMQEDGWAEWATFAAFAAAGTLGLRRARATTQLERLLLLGVSLFCLFVAGEEISWGQRLFGYRPPQFFLERNFQQEANLHNLLKNVLDTRFMVMIIALGYGVAAPFLSFLALLPRALAPARALLPYFACVAWLELSYPYELVGELAELLLGLLFLADIAARLGPDALASARGSAGAQLVALASALLLMALNGLVLQLHADEFSKATRIELAYLADRLQEGGTLRAALFRKQHVHKRLYTAARAGYVELPRDEYALDPWNNPYWIAFHRSAAGTGKLLVYSFGANHQRESDVDAFAGRGFSFQGDDLGVLLDVSVPTRAAR